MIGLDTNVLVRYIMQDDVWHSAKATKLIESPHRGAVRGTLRDQAHAAIATAEEADRALVEQ